MKFEAISVARLNQIESNPCLSFVRRLSVMFVMRFDRSESIERNSDRLLGHQDEKGGAYNLNICLIWELLSNLDREIFS